MTYGDIFMTLSGLSAEELNQKAHVGTETGIYQIRSFGKTSDADPGVAVGKIFETVV
jgi:hypothetical protein